MQDTAVAIKETAVLPAFSMTPRTFDEALKFAELMSKSDLVPKDFKDKPGNILVAIQKGQEVGLSPMAALETIAVINGRASLWGDGLLGIVQGSAVYEWIDESQCSEKSGVCTVKRKGEQPYTATFTLEDAKRAGLLGKAGPWTSYTKRMLQLRARGFALRDKFADVLKGLVAAEEAMDTVTILPAESDTTKPSSLKEKLQAQLEPPKQDATMVQPATDKYTGEPKQEEDGAGLDVGGSSSLAPNKSSEPQQASDAPPAQSPSAFARQMADQMDDQYDEGIITNYVKYQGTKSYQAKMKPGFFDLEDGQGGIVRRLKYFDLDLDVTSGMKRVYYRTESSKQYGISYVATKIEAME